MRVHLSRPDITDREIQAVVDVLKTPNLSFGPKLPEFEQAFADYIGTSRAVAVNSGTSALYLCLLAMGVGPGDEVITTPFTFIATSNCVMMVGAKPVFVDIDPVSLNIDPDAIAAKITDKNIARTKTNKIFVFILPSLGMHHTVHTIKKSVNGFRLKAHRALFFSSGVSI